MSAGGPAAAATVLLAVALATERWVALVRAAVAPLTARHPGAVDGDAPARRGRRLALNAAALAGAWAAAATLAGGPLPAAAWGAMELGAVRAPVPLVALAACGVAACWGRVLQWMAAARDAALARRAAERLRGRARAERLGIAPPPETARRRRAGEEDRRARLRLLLDAQAPERLDAPAGRAA